MGQTLSEPVVDKESASGADDRLFWGLSSMQGWRISMEDAHAAILDLQEDESKKTPQEERVSFFGVYDGHGGERVASYSGKNVHKIVASQSSFKAKNYAQALRDGFLATDRAILQDKSYRDELSGCTATVSLVTNSKIYVANSGDSRTVLGIKGRAKPLSQDHKPQNEAEKARIVAAGGFVDFGRVNGNLALSRAIGDFEFKKNAELPPEQQIVTAFPDVSEHDITADDEFIVLACDGIWDCEPSQSVIEFVRRGIAAHQPLDKICENMMNKCISNGSDSGGVGCDNMTMIVVGLLQGKTQEEWYNTISKRVADGDGPCAPPEYGKNLGWPVHYDSSPDEFDSQPFKKGDSTRTTRGSGRIIVLGDGTEVLSDTEDAEMFDDEGKDEEELEKKKSPGSKVKDDEKKNDPPKCAEAASNGNPEVVIPDQSSC
ncbi:protein phosphatase 2C [Terfezia boudieri ATCC MYA-4762]|uniref:Protein phosphatase 2C homolog 2 n=1 Tax=Terfezia boudieri ATCC MYA-4762 TaxID=1051890 RepID=A0A3N4M3N7_9PEZI|nr:protein phosphatase 2C [Terfezia boudieri ATCC MYA-4762]